MTFYAEMLDVSRRLNIEGIETLVPQPDDCLLQPHDDEAYKQYKLTVSKRHLRQIRDNQKTYGILVMNLDKHGLPDYIGANTFAEIAVAFAHYKPIFLFQGMPDLYQDELNAWGVHCLHGSLSGLVAAYRDETAARVNQLALFEE